MKVNEVEKQNQNGMKCACALLVFILNAISHHPIKRCVCAYKNNNNHIHDHFNLNAFYMLLNFLNAIKKMVLMASFCGGGAFDAFVALWRCRQTKSLLCLVKNPMRM